ncbi:MAG: HAD-IIA family hydrolase [Bacteroidales bacterium]|nr:HAD-IIA family hydrolase [Bacteroidales bacterium]
MNSELAGRLRDIRHVVLDMDGTIYLSNTLFPFTNPFLAGLDEMGISHTFLTNNPSKSLKAYHEKLEKMGVAVDDGQMLTTVQATIDYIHTSRPDVRKLFILGTPSMVTQFEAAGFISTADDPDDVPDAIVAAFDMTLEYKRLCRAAWWISRGLPYFATNPDRVCPTNERTVLVDCGSICACLESATGRKPDKTLGKPDPEMLLSLASKLGLKPSQMAMVGDRVYTDIAMACNAGAFGVLVLSGETTPEMAARAPQQPDLIVENIGELGRLLKLARQ